MRTVSAYAYSAAGPGESTTDLAWDGQAMVHELGVLLAQSSRFGDDPEITYADIDVQRLRLERMRTGTFNDAAAAAEHPERRSEEHTSELQSLMRISYAVFCLKKKNTKTKTQI